MRKKSNIQVVNRCYFCDTPFEIFTSIHIELREKNDADLYIINRFPDVHEIVKRLEEINIFRKIIIINEQKLYKTKAQCKNLFFCYLSALSAYFNIEKIVPKYIPDVVYKSMFFTCHILCIRLARFYFIKHKYNTKYYMFDEGIGSYDGQFERSNIMNTIIKRMMFGKEANKMVFPIFLYQPKLLYNYKKRKLPVYQINPFDDFDRKNKNLYHYVFHNNNIKIKQKYIFFDTVREEMFLTKKTKSKMQKWYELIENILGIENLIVKPHPRQTELYKYKAEIYPNTFAPMEVDYMGMDLDMMTFISVASTAVVSPKIVFNKEPNVLLLCCMDYDTYTPTNKQIIFFERVKALYQHKERFMMPKNENELFNYLKNIKLFIN